MKKTRKKTIRRAVGAVLLAYLLYMVGSCVLPYISPPALSAEKRAELDGAVYTAESTGPDRALLAESTTDAFAVRVAMLRAAEQSVDFVVHTVQYGESAQALFGELVAAADRGVAVRVVLDGKAGALTGDARRMVRCVAGHENIAVREYNPVNLLWPYGWNAILHDKFMVVDGNHLLLGGRNVGDAYFAPDAFARSVTNDRDVFVTRAGSGESVLEQAAAYMELLWNSESMRPAGTLSPAKTTQGLADLRGARLAFEDTHPRYYQNPLAYYTQASLPTNRITLLHNPINPGVKEPWIGYALATLMQRAEQSVVLQTPYATANTHFLAALQETAARVPTTLLTNSLASSPNFPAYSGYHANRGRFAATGTEIWEYQSVDSIHGKSMVVDGRISAVGSFNMDDRSLAIDTETMLVIDSVPFAESLQAAMDGYLAESARVSGDGKGYASGAAPLEVPAGKRFGMWAFSLISRPLRFLMAAVW